MWKILAVVREDVSFDLELWIAEVDEEALFPASGTHEAKELCHVFVGEVFDGFELNDKFVLDHEVHFKAAQLEVVFIKDIKTSLLFNNDPLFGESMGESIFIDFLLQSMLQKTMLGERSLPDCVAQLEDF